MELKKSCDVVLFENDQRQGGNYFALLLGSLLKMML